jgi:hypothetical protein
MESSEEAEVMEANDFCAAFTLDFQVFAGAHSMVERINS